MPRADRAVRLCRHLGVDTDWLFDDTLGWPPAIVDSNQPRVVRDIGYQPPAPAGLWLAHRVISGPWRGRASLDLREKTQVVAGEDERPAGNWVPILAPVAAGTPREAHDGGYPAGAAEAWVRFDADDDRAFALRVDGDSMAPDFLHGDIIIVRPAEGRKFAGLVSGAAALVIFGGERTATFKLVRFGHVDARGQVSDYLLEPINPAHPRMRLERGEIAAIFPVIGMVRKT